MKKLALTIAILFALTLCATAQNGGGLFQRGTMPDEAYYENDYGRTTGGLILPGEHGQNTDADAPLGSGIAVLMGLGAAYAFAKKHEEE